MEHHTKSKWFEWEHDLVEELNSQSTLQSTPLGEIEYAIRGSGPVIVGIHGAPGGYDQIFAHLPELITEGFSVLGWSRPGYLRTSLEVGKTIDQQADALAALLDALAIDKVGIYGMSAGGPIALAFSIRYPDRVWGLVMESAISQHYSVQSNSTLQQIFSKLLFNDFGMWLWDRFSKSSPKSTMRQLIAMESSLTPKQAVELLDHVMEDPKKVEYAIDMIESTCPISLRKVGLNNDVEQCASLSFLPVQTLKCPILVMHGTADADVPIQHAEFVATFAPGAEFCRVEAGFHLLKLSDQADELHSSKLAFLKKHQKF